MKKFLIGNARSGLVFGVYEAPDEAGALDTLAREAGYASYEAMNEDVPADPGEIEIVEIIKPL